MPRSRSLASQAVLLIGGDKRAVTGSTRSWHRSRSACTRRISPRSAETMATRPFSELRARMSPEHRERNRQRALAELLEMELRELRKFSGTTQVEVAALLKTTQSQVSLAEKRADHLLSTLRRYVEALGGELDVVARFGDRSIRLRGV